MIIRLENGLEKLASCAGDVAVLKVTVTPMICIFKPSLIQTISDKARENMKHADLYLLSNLSRLRDIFHVAQITN